MRPACRARPQRPRRLDEREPLRPRPGRRAHGDQGERRLVRRPDPGGDGGLRSRRQRRRRRPRAVERHADARVRLPRDGRRWRHCPYPQPLRDRVGGPRGGDPVRSHRDGRRVRRADPGRPLRPDRRRGDRSGDRRDARVAPVTGGAHAQPRRVHDRGEPARRDQGRRDVRGRRADRAPRVRAGRARSARRTGDRRAVRALPERLRTALTPRLAGSHRKD